MLQETRKLEQSVRDQATGITNTIEKLNNINPVAAMGIYKELLQYLQDKTGSIVKERFTIKELEELGYL